MSGLLVPLGIGRGDVVAAVGAGGKTTLVYARWRAEARAPAGACWSPPRRTWDAPRDEDGRRCSSRPRAMSDAGRATRPCATTAARPSLGRRVRADKLEGVAAGARRRAGEARRTWSLVEADGARGRSLKAPAAHEPVVPRSCTLLVVLAAPRRARHAGRRATLVHRPEVVAASTGRPDEPVTEDALVACLAHPRGYPARLGARPASAVFLNKVEDDARARPPRHGSPRVCAHPTTLVVAGSARGDARRLR